jgi:NTP pyrophosphatase (non-canonical NTP hydrolase)
MAPIVAVRVILVGMGDRLVEFQREVRAFTEERDWQQFQTPKNLAMALAGEVGELLAEFQWLTPDESARVMGDPDAGARVAAEIGDVVIYLTRLADVLGVDLVEVAREKLADSATRYPVEGSRGSVRKAPASVRGEVV